jgi:hypothetical protein
MNKIFASRPANDRYLQVLASVENTTSLGELTARLCRPTKRNGKGGRSR